MTLGVLLVALLVMIPMSIAGGLPYLFAATGLMVMLSIRANITGRSRIHPKFKHLIFAALLLLIWEVVIAMYHGTIRDVEYIASRGLWCVLGFCYFTLLSGEHPKDLIANLRKVFFISLSLLLVAMAIESAFYPRWEMGRQMGIINIPWPRSTGVPQSDGKIGVYICISLVFFCISYFKDRRHTSLVGIVLSIAPILFTQSRSTLLGMLATLALVYIYLFISSRNVYAKILAYIFGASILLIFLLNFEFIYLAVRGEGVFAENVGSRSLTNQYGMQLVYDNPIFGVGANALLLDGVGIHNTFVSLAVKSGILAPVLYLYFIFYSASFSSSAKVGRTRNIILIAALVAGVISEHSLYAGLFNEHLWLISLVAIAINYMMNAQATNVARHRQARKMRSTSSLVHNKAHD